MYNYAGLSSSDNPESTSVQGELRSKIHPQDEGRTYCLEIIYKFDVQLPAGSLQVLKNGEVTIFSSDSFEVKSKWITTRINFGSTAQFFLLLKGKVTNGMIQVQRLKVKQGFCLTHSSEVKDFHCNFEFGNCDIEPTGSLHQFTRLQLKRAHLNRFTDHTSHKSDAFLLALKLIADHEASEAGVQLPSLTYTGSACLRFYLQADIPIGVGSSLRLGTERLERN
jgi:hypothetical protein